MKLLERALAIAAPHTCLGCGREGAILCPWCMPDKVPLLPFRCYRCKQFTDNGRVCDACRKSGGQPRHVWVRTTYSEMGKRLVYQLKFNRAKAAAIPIAALIDEVVPWLDPDTVIVHIPTASSRRRIRGYDQSELIAKELVRLRGLRHESWLVRIGQSRQVGAKRSERLLQLKAAFMPHSNPSIKGSKVLLVDDIVTSGGTLEAATRALRKAGAKTIDAVVFAQKQ